MSEPKKNIIKTPTAPNTFKPADATNPPIVGGPLGRQNPPPTSTATVTAPKASEQPSSGNSSSSAEPIPTPAAPETPAVALLKKALGK